MVSSVSMQSIERCMVCAIGCLECRVFFFVGCPLMMYGHHVYHAFLGMIGLCAC